MPSNRPIVLAEQIRRIVSEALYFQLRDPNLDGVTITRVKASPDLQYADVFFSLSGENPNPGKATRALQQARGPLKRQLAKNISLKRVPELRFHHDEALAAEQRISDILSKIEIPEPDSNET